MSQKGIGSPKLLLKAKALIGDKIKYQILKHLFTEICEENGIP